VVALSVTAALRFQPTKRPQIASQKANVKSAAPKAFAPVSSAPKQPTASSEEPSTIARPPPPPKTTLADWTNEADEDEYGFVGEKRQRGGRKKRKKNKEEMHVTQNWDDIYDPSRPNNYEEYRHSDERIREIRDWKDTLYAHRMKQRHSSFDDSDDDSGRRPISEWH
jgi:splicing factor 45